ncbi:MAG: GAF domain-containing protein [Asticcacaulis sp.]|uniref:GAF domain-containing protein n=1 Tax=Asticcacaulis sp. TaxID=1872648 RepID=UPI003F7B44A1
MPSDALRVEKAKIERAREVFFGGKGLPVDQISHAILRSWIRCANMGLDAQTTPHPDAASASELRLLQEKHEALRRLARNELDMLHAEARDLSGIVILTNARGEVLDAVGDPSFADKAAQVALRPGAQWSEDGNGTNAIGTAIAERRSVAVNGAEHYFNGHGALSCAATPIIDPRGATIGVLDISTPAYTQGGYVLGMVRMAVEQIEHRLFRGGFDGCQTLRFQTDPHLLGASREGILVFRDGVIVAANRRGLSLVGRTWDHLDQVQVEEVFETQAETLAQGWNGAVRLRGADGRDYFAQLDARQSQPETLSTTELGAPSLEDIELAAMRRAVAQYGGNISAAARSLGVHRSTLYRRLNPGG